MCCLVLGAGLDAQQLHNSGIIALVLFKLLAQRFNLRLAALRYPVNQSDYNINHFGVLLGFGSNQALVVPAISWSTPISYDFCFDGVEKGSTVAVGMIGCKGNKTGFMRGYNEMLNRIQPDKIICYGTPFPEMQGDIIVVNYNNYKRKIATTCP